MSSSLSTVFSLLASSLSSSSSTASTIENITSSSVPNLEQGETIRDNGTEEASIFSSIEASTLNTTTAYSKSPIGTSTPTTESNNADLLSTSESSNFRSNETNFDPISARAETPLLEEDILNGTITEISNSTFGFSDNANFGGNSSSANITNELEFQNVEDDASNYDLFPTTTTNYSVENFGEEKDDPTTYVPLFYFLLTVLLGIYVYLYFLQRHLKAKAERKQEDEAKERVEERAKRGGCRYDFEDDYDSDYGPQEQNLSVAALRFYGGGGRK